MLYPRQEYYIMPQKAELTAEKLGEWLRRHQRDCERMQYLKDLYEGRHPIQLQPKKELWKPDNRIICNHAKYIVDRFNGFFLGIPVKTMHPDEAVSAELEEIQKYNDQDDNNAELSKYCSIYGSGFELLYTDEDARIRITYLSPLECFLIYDDSVARKPLYGVRYYKNTDGETVGSVFTASEVIPFSDKDGLHFGTPEPHYFGGVPLIEYIENEERQGAFEQVESAITGYEKAISEKANDVDYFADAYLLMLGVNVDKDDLHFMHSNRIIHVGELDAEELNAVRVEFLQRPSADTTQENLLNRLEDQIYTQSMVANISDEDFGGSSGTALAYKLQPMRDLAAGKARKFSSGMNRRWQLVASSPASRMPADAWKAITYRFTENLPKNLLEEVQAAAQMAGITSRETQLSVISAVDDPQTELQKIEAENGTIPEDSYKAERSAGTEVTADAE